VKVEKLNPSVRVIFYQTLNLTGKGDEQTAVRFTLKGEEVINVNNVPKSLVELTRGGSKGRNTRSGGGGIIDATTGQVMDR